MAKELVPGTLFAVFLFLIALDRHDHLAALMVSLATGVGWLHYVPKDDYLKGVLWLISVALFIFAFIFLFLRST